MCECACVRVRVCVRMLKGCAAIAESRQNCELLLNCVCACVRVCMRACVRAHKHMRSRACMCMCACMPFSTLYVAL